MEKVLSTVLSSPDSYQEIEAALTEMESCMKLLFPKFDLTDIQSRLQSSPAARECPSAYEQPCCSRDLVDDGKETIIKRQEEESCVEGKGAKDEPMTEEERRRHNEEAAGKKGEEEEEDGDEEEGHSEDEDDSFIRSSGLVSHSYSLDLNISRGGFND